MLTLLLCSQVFTLSQLPSQDWLALVSQGYRCPAQLTQQPARAAFADIGERLAGRWGACQTVLGPAQAAHAQAGDLIRLDSPAQLRGEARLAALERAAQVGAQMLVVQPASRPAPTAFMTLLLSRGLPVGAVYIQDLSRLNQLTHGTFVVEQLSGVPLPPLDVRRSGARLLSAAALCAGSARADETHPGAELERPAPDRLEQGPSGASGPAMRWSFAGLHFSTDMQRPGWRRLLILEGLPAVWTLGSLMLWPLPSFIAAASRAFAWMVLGLAVGLLLIFLPAALRRRARRRP